MVEFEIGSVRFISCVATLYTVLLVRCSLSHFFSRALAKSQTAQRSASYWPCFCFVWKMARIKMLLLTVGWKKIQIFLHFEGR